MKKVLTKQDKERILIGVDVGNGDTKTATSKMQTGIKNVDDSSFAQNVLEMDGIISVIGEEHLAYEEDRTNDESYRRITCQAIANELRANKMKPGVHEIFLGIGVPFQHRNVMKDKFISYFCKKPEMIFTSNSEKYHVRLCGVSVMPQGYSAVAMQLGRYRGHTWIVDIGNGTLDCITLNHGVANESKSFTVKLGTQECYLMAKKNLKNRTMMDLPYEVFESYMIRGNEDLNLPNKWVNCIDSSAREYCKKVFSTLSEHGYSDAFTNLVFLGGGAGIIKKFCEDSHNFVFITDVHANAKGYEDFYYNYLLRKGDIYE